jgi:hypothetical protein
MKRIVLAAVMIAATAGSASADKDIGCGLGTKLWEGEKGLAPKVLGATTNGTFGNQTFGITTGTLGCSSEGVITADARLRMFAGANLDNLARDMAHGQGETLDAFATLMNVSESDKPAFFRFARAHFTDIFATPDATAGDVIATLNRLLAADPALSDYARS